MTDLPSVQSGGVNIEGDTSVGADLVGRDKITLNFIVQLQQLAREIQHVVNEQHNDLAEATESDAMNWLNWMNGSLLEVAKCETEHTPLCHNT